MTDERTARAWWKEAVVYQIYPRSFNDADGDGIGDLRGIVERADYLDALGVDVVWLCPVYDSPQADNGYDIRDYRAIDETFGTMGDFEAVLEALHARDIRLVMDLVVNHTSDEHEWFQRSRERDPSYEDYYYWRDGTPDEPPNDWESFFGGSAWSYDEGREQWYLHLFDERQPDLNWRNPAVRDDVADLVTWWLEKGIDGFRIDAISFISKPEGLPDGEADVSPRGKEQFSHGPRIHEYLRELYERTFANYDVMTVAEMDDTTVEMAADYLGESGDGLNMIFHFEHMDLDVSPEGRFVPDEWGEWSLPAFKRIVSRWQTELAADGWNAQYLGNHDQPRIVSRFGDDDYRVESAKLLATFLLTTRGTPYVYQGEEIGMTNADFTSLEAFDDPMTVGAAETLLAAGEVDSFEEIREFLNYVSRDHARTPMQWSPAANTGFTDGDPWFRLNDNYPEVNVEAARADEDSVWHYYRSLIDLRSQTDTLVYGDYQLHLPDDERLYVYSRTLDDDAFLVALNWSGERATLGEFGADVDDATVVVGSHDDPAALDETFRPYEAVVYRRRCKSSYTRPNDGVRSDV